MRQPTTIALHDRMRRLRLTADISSETLADFLGLTVQTVTAREVGTRHLFSRETRRYIRAVLAIDSGRARDVARLMLHTPPTEWTGETARKVRQRADIPMDRIASVLKVSTATIWNWEQEAGTWREDRAVRYMAAITRIVTMRTEWTASNAKDLLASVPIKGVVLPARRGRQESGVTVP